MKPKQKQNKTKASDFEPIQSNHYSCVSSSRVSFHLIFVAALIFEKKKNYEKQNIYGIVMCIELRSRISRHMTFFPVERCVCVRVYTMCIFTIYMLSCDV